MRFAYMDEAGNTGRKLDDSKQPIHLILSLVIDEEKIPFVHEHIREAGRRHCPRECRKAKFEFHGSDLYAARGPFSETTPENASKSSMTCSRESNSPKPRWSFAGSRRQGWSADTHPQSILMTSP